MWVDTPRYTLDYAPPEALQQTESATYSKAFDVWCLGATLYCMYMGHAPFRQSCQDRKINEANLKQRILNEDFYKKSNWLNASAEFKDLIEGCLKKQAERRLTLDEILQHSWFQLMERQQRQQRMAVEAEKESRREAAATEQQEENIVDNQSEQDNLTNQIVYDEDDEDACIGDIIEQLPDMEDEDFEQPIETYKLWDQRQQTNTSSLPSDDNDENRESEGDTTSGLGHSKSSDLNLRAEESQNVQQCSELELSMECSQTLQYFNEDNDINRELTNNYCKQIEELLILTKHCKEKLTESAIIVETKQEQIDHSSNVEETEPKPNTTTVEPTTSKSTKAKKATKRGGRQPATSKRKITQQPKTQTKQKESVEKIPAILEEISTKSKRINRSTSNKHLAKNALTQKHFVPIATDSSTLDFLGFQPSECQIFARKAKSNWRMFCVMLSNTQSMLRRFNIKRQVYGNKNKKTETAKTAVAAGDSPSISWDKSSCIYPPRPKKVASRSSSRKTTTTTRFSRGTNSSASTPINMAKSSSSTVVSARVLRSRYVNE